MIAAVVAGSTPGPHCEMSGDNEMRTAMTITIPGVVTAKGSRTARIEALEIVPK